MIEEDTSLRNSSVESATSPQKASRSERSLTFLIAAAILLTDLATKLVIENNLAISESYVPIQSIEAIFKITHVSNTGAAFGIFPTGGNVIMVIAVIVSIVIVVYNQRLAANHTLFRVALGLQLGGALGNLLSRIRIGHVTDFLDFGPWPVSNIADISIVLGVIILGILMFFEKEDRPEAREEIEIDDPSEKSPIDSNDDSSMIWNE